MAESIRSSYNNCISNSNSFSSFSNYSSTFSNYKWRRWWLHKEASRRSRRVCKIRSLDPGSRIH